MIRHCTPSLPPPYTWHLSTPASHAWARQSCASEFQSDRPGPGSWKFQPKGWQMGRFSGLLVPQTAEPIFGLLFPHWSTQAPLLMQLEERENWR